MPQSRGVLADANAFAVMTGAIESLRRMAQEQPHPVWDATQQLILQQAARFNGRVCEPAFVGSRTSGAAHGCSFRGLATCVTVASSPETKGMPRLLGEVVSNAPKSAVEFVSLHGRPPGRGWLMLVDVDVAHFLYI